MHSFRALAFLVLSSTLSLSSCSSYVNEPTDFATKATQSITGGSEDQADPPVVGILRIQGNEGELCTGSLLAPNLVLTARHCVAQSPETVTCGSNGAVFGDLYLASSFHVTTLWNGPKQAVDAAGKLSGAWYSVAKVVVPHQSKSVCGYDVAFLHLQGAGIPASEATPLIPKVDENVQSGANYRAVGFGLDGSSGAGLRRTRPDLTVKCVGNCSDTAVDNAHEWTGQEGVCQGDSGGPALDDSGRVVGVVSRGMSGCTDPVYGSVYAWRDWIKGNGVVAAKAGGYAQPSWAEGGSEEGISPASPTGTACSSNFDCASGLCFTDLSAAYCSIPCLANGDCPKSYRCDSTVKACAKSDFGTMCSSPDQCHDKQCVVEDFESYCSQTCQSTSDCPESASCESGLCLAPGSASTKPAKNGCAIALASTKWSCTFAFATLLTWIVRRIRLRAKSTDKA